MAEASSFKSYINRAAITRLGEHIRTADSGFDLDAFVKTASRGLGPLEFTARTRHVAAALRHHLPDSMPRALAIVRAALPEPLEGDEGMFSERYWLWPLSDFVRDYGATHWREALDTCYALTQSFTAEFAIRPLLASEPEATLKALAEWTEDESAHVRRLCSEGPRPRLPWASRLDMPREPVAGILHALRADTSRYVRKSVANHLNDIGKHDPAWLLDTMQRWDRRAADETRWIIRHALRTLIKAGDSAALALIGYKPVELSNVSLQLTPKQVKIGDEITARLRLETRGGSAQALLIDWVMHYARKGGASSRKVFKGKTVELEPGEVFDWPRKFDMTPRSTRSLHPGTHTLEVQVNGDIVARETFTLL